MAITYWKGCNLKWHTSIQEHCGLPMKIEVEVGLNEGSSSVYNITTYSKLKTKGAKPHSSFQLEKCDLTSLISEEWINSRVKYCLYVMVKSKHTLIQQIIAAYLDLLQDSAHVSTCMLLCCNPTNHYIIRE